jgi:CRISPR-associated protein Cas1
MQLILNSYGAYLRKKDDCFLVKIEDKEHEVYYKKVSNILVTTSVYISSDALKMALENNIDVVFLDEFGEPYGRVWHSKLGSTTLIRRQQLELSTSDKGFDIAKQWIVIKMDNQENFLKKLLDKRENNVVLQEAIEKVEEFKNKIIKLSGNSSENRDILMGFEGNASRYYFQAISSIMPEKYKFNNRSRNPALDEFNALLNYGYGVLYSKVEKACLIAGLEPYLGFLHADNYNKKSLVFDLIERYRDMIDRVVVFQFSGRHIKDSFFEKAGKGFVLNKEGKQFLIALINQTFDNSVRYKNKNIKNIDRIQIDSFELAQNLLKGRLNVSVGDI